MHFHKGIFHIQITMPDIDHTSIVLNGNVEQILHATYKKRVSLWSHNDVSELRLHPPLALGGENMYTHIAYIQTSCVNTQVQKPSHIGGERKKGKRSFRGTVDLDRGHLSSGNSDQARQKQGAAGFPGYFLAKRRASLTFVHSDDFCHNVLLGQTVEVSNIPYRNTN